MISRKKPRAERKGEHLCSKCGAIHYYHFAKCSRCGHKNPSKRKLVYTSIRGTAHDSEEIGALVAMIITVRGCRGRSKKELLYTILERETYLYKWIILAYDRTKRMGFRSTHLEKVDPQYGPSTLWNIVKSRLVHGSGLELTKGRWKAHLLRYPTEFITELNSILDKKLDIGLSVQGINKVLKKLGREEISAKKKRILKKNST